MKDKEVKEKPAGTPIHNATELLRAMQFGLAGKYYLANDIDARGIKSTLIRKTATPFTGILDGNGHTITLPRKK